MISKKYIIIALLPFLMCLMVSCANFLDEVNPNTITEDQFWESESDFQKGLMATYRVLEMSNVLGGTGAISGHVAAETTMPSPWDAWNIELNEFNVSDVNSYVTNKWRELYQGVFRANQVLDKLEESDLSESFKTGIAAEARFLRGLYYFWLATTYNKGSVVIHTTLPKNYEDYSKPLSPKEDVYSLIIDDLKFAQTNLPRSWNNENLGRATWGAATAFLGQVYLYEKRYEDAKKEFKSIIDSELYKLTPEYGWNFDLEHEHNSESIFEVNFSDAVKPGESTNHATSRARSIAPQEAGGSRSIEPAYNFIILCKQDPIDPSNPINQDMIYSQRALGTMCFKGDGQTFYQRPSYEFPFIVNQEAHIKKFQNWQWEQEPNTSRSGINERVMRYADVLLMYAETILETTGNVSEAITYINQVRERSGVMKLVAAEYDKVKLMRHLMRVERPIELAFEGHMIRWQDLRRWGIVEEVYKELSQISYCRQENSTLIGVRVATPEDLANPNAVIIKQFEATARNYTKDKDFFPIPNIEVVNNHWLSE